MRRGKFVWLTLPLFAFLLAGQGASAEEMLDQQSPGPVGLGQSPSDAVEWAQTFTVGVSGTLSRIEVYILKILNVTQNLTVTIYDADSGVPTTALGSATLFSDTITGSADFRTVDFAGLDLNVTAGDKLAFGLKKNPDSGIHIMPFGGDAYAGGNSFSRILGTPPGAWVAQPTVDFGFKTYVNVEAATELFGDYNDDHVIDAADYTVWRNTIGTDGTLLNDFSPEYVDEDDYLYWKSHYGDSSFPGGGGLAGALIPEPTTIALLCLGALAASLMSQHCRPNRYRG